MTEEVVEKGIIVSLEVVWQDSNRKHDARLSELSRTGGHIDCLYQARVGDKFEFKLRLPNGLWVPLQGVISYDEYPVGFGFQFINQTNDSRNIIENLVTGRIGKDTPTEKNLEPEIPADIVVGEENIQADTEKTVRQPSRRILVADDDLMTLRMLSVIIESQNYMVVTANDGREAFRILQHDNNFDAAVFDMTMPHLDGLDLIAYMKSDERLQKIPIGMVTAEQDPKIWDESIAAGANVFLPKPFSPPQVVMMIKMLCGRKSA